MNIITSSSINTYKNSKHDRINTDSEMTNLQKASHNFPILEIKANADAINTLIDVLLPPIVENFEDIDSDDLAGIGLKASIRMEKPSICINKNHASGTANLSIYLLGGIKFLETWTWITIPIPNAQLTLGLDLETDSQNKTIFLKFTNVENVNINLDNIPKIFDSEKHTLIALFNEIIKSFKEFIDNELSQIKIPLFQLPDTFPGTNIKANLNLYDVSITNNRIQALIQINQ